MESRNNSEIISWLDCSDKGKSSLWRYLAGFTLSVFVFFVLAGFGMFPLILFVPDYKESLALSVLTTLMAFIIPFIVIPFIVRLLHQRP